MTYKNVVLCDECFKGGEEKSCGHGLALVPCTDCGKVRTEKDPPWHCIGGMPDVIIRAGDAS